MQIRLRPLQFKYVGGMAQAIAIGSVYSLVMLDDGQQFTAHVTGYALEPIGDKFQAHVVAANLGGGTFERCAFICQQHFESAVADFIRPAAKVAAESPARHIEGERNIP